MQIKKNKFVFKKKKVFEKWIYAQMEFKTVKITNEEIDAFLECFDKKGRLSVSLTEIPGVPLYTAKPNNIHHNN